MNPITWSVVITTKNRFPLLRRAIDSALAQTMPCEIVVIDDGSTDETSTVASIYPTIRYICNEESIGHSAAANLGISAATGSWIKPLDDDDHLSPRCLELMADALLKAPEDRRPVMVSAAGINVNPQGHPIGKLPPALPLNGPLTLDSETLLELMMLDQAPIGAPVQVAHSRRAALDCGGWNERNRLLYGDDTEFWIRLAHQGGCVFLPEHLGFRTIWGSNNSARVSILDRYKAVMTLKGRIGPVPGSVASSLALHLALAAVKEKDTAALVKLLSRYIAKPWAIIRLIRRYRFSDARKQMAALSS